MYMFIQREYWDVGFLRYYTWRQLPNFALAAPMISLSITTLARVLGPSSAGHKTHAATDNAALTRYAVHHAFLLVNALLVVHIQVTTRLLVACPTVFWLPARQFFVARESAARGRAVVAFSLLYSVLGAVLFSAFYPWT
ncbi:hypothetical protein PINS_up023272 [Pythium insidiosum]|nr:hypothetical protein PINS_up023272 [Pythium insidiosum]